VAKTRGSPVIGPTAGHRAGRRISSPSLIGVGSKKIQRGLARRRWAATA